MATCITTNNEREWLEARRSAITATQVAKLAESWSNYAEIAAEKDGKSTFKGNAYTRFGQYREPFIAQWAMDNSDALQVGKNLKPNTRLWRREDNPRHACTPDMISEDALVQIKTVGTRKLLGALEDHAWPPQLHIDQMQWEMYVMEKPLNVLVYEPRTDKFIGKPDNSRPLSDLFSVYGGSIDAVPQGLQGCKTLIIERDDERIRFLIGIAERFEKQYFEKQPSFVDDRVVELARKLDVFVAEGKEIKAKEEAIREEILEIVGSAPQSIDVGFGIVTIPKLACATMFDSRRFKAENPDQYKKYLKPKKAKASVRYAPKSKED